MCGITGFVDYHKEISEQDLLNASKALRHRGGNGYGHIHETQGKYSFGLANERLATIDTSVDSLQPFTSNCGNYTITFNGTIYNYIELRSTLIKYGVTFKSLSDTEVLLESYKRWGFEFFQKIDGAFAFAIVDRKKSQLLIARDALGVKPLYFYRDQNFFAFSSELKAMFAYPIEKKLNLNSVEFFLRRGHSYGEETIYQDIRKFKKKHFFLIDLNSGNLLEDKFDDFSLDSFDAINNELELTEKIHELLTASVLRRNVADVNVGVILNGGYDSATVAAILQKKQVKRLRTFTLGFENQKKKGFYATRAIAKHLNTFHSEYFIDHQGAVATLEKMVDIFDEPVGDSVAISLAYLSREISNEGIKVLLGAEGGNELFAGNSNYKKATWLNEHIKHLPEAMKKIAIGISKRNKGRLTELLYAGNLVSVYEALQSPYAVTDLKKLLNKEINQKTYTDQAPNIKTLISLDIDNLSNHLLLIADQVAMHYGLDHRDTLLKADLVNLLKNIDKKWFVRNGSLKYILKSITQQYIPKKLMLNSEKDLSIPLTNWMKSIYKPHLEAYLSVEQLHKHQLFDTAEVLKTKKSFFSNPNLYEAKKLWLLLQFQMWHEKNFN